MASDEFDRDEFEQFLNDHTLDFQHRESSAVPEKDCEKIVYSAPVANGFILILQLKLATESTASRYTPDDEVLALLAHERDPDRYLIELVSMPITSEWRQSIQEQVDTAFDRVQDLKQCEDCDLPMLNYHDYAGTFYACVSFDCENITEVETLDQRQDTES
jgi:hypothetical protein